MIDSKANEAFMTHFLYVLCKMAALHYCKQATFVDLKCVSK